MGIHARCHVFGVSFRTVPSMAVVSCACAVLRLFRAALSLVSGDSVCPGVFGTAVLVVCRMGSGGIGTADRDKDFQDRHRRL